MCKRSDGDPLVRHFVDQYRLNLLSIPREHAEPGDLYVRDDHGIAAPGALAAYLTPPPQLPEPRRDEAVSGLTGQLSNRVSARLGLGLLEGFLTALGAAAIVGKLQAGYERAHASTVRFRFAAATRDALDPGLLGQALGGCALDTRNAFVTEGNRYYVTAAVVRADSLSILAEDSREQRVDLGADLLATVSAEAGLDAKRTDTGEVTYSGKQLAIGVELYELHESPEGQLRLGTVDDALRLRGRPQRPAHTLIGGLDGEALIAIAG